MRSADPRLGGWDDPESADATTAGDATDGAAGDTAAPRDTLAEARALLAGAGLPRRRQWLGSRRRQAVAGAVLLAAVGFVAYQGLTNATQYFLTTKQAVQQRATLGTKPFRIEGTVEHDVRQVGEKVYFTIYNGGVAVQVVSTGSPPQLFRAGIPVVLDGHWQGGFYASDLIMVKHTASYTEAHPDRLKSQLPKSGSGS